MTDIRDETRAETSLRQNSTARRFAVALALVLLFVVFVRLRHPETRFGIDDANIFLVYAEHLSSGDGLVFNVGGERVEGFSSPLWVLIAALFSLAWADPTLLLLGLNVVVTAAALVISAAVLECGARRGRQREGDRGPAALTPAFVILLVWCLAAPGYVLWTTLTLMETGVWSALLVASLGVVCVGSRAETSPQRQDLLLCACVCGLTLCRPEGALWALVFVVLHGLVQARRAGSLRTGARRSRLPLLGCGALVTSATLSRVAVFGHPLPNTYYAKMSPDLAYNLREGATYALAFLSYHAIATLFLGVAVASALALGGRTLWLLAAERAGHPLRRSEAKVSDLESTCFAASVVVSVGFVIPILAGGDHFAAFRHYQPIWPLLPIPAFLVAIALAQRVGRGRSEPAHLSAGWGVAGSLLACAAYLPFSLVSSSSWSNLQETGLIHEFGIAKVGRETGAYLSRCFDADARPRVGVVSSGALKFTYAGEVVDLMGLNDSLMAHRPGDRYGMKNHAAFSKEVFYQLLPDIVVLPLDTLIPPHADLRDYEQLYRDGVAREALKDIFRDPSFSSAYTLAAIKRSGIGTGDSRLGGYFRNEYLEGLEDSGDYAVQRLR